jgi:hypothetical protein
VEQGPHLSQGPALKYDAFSELSRRQRTVMVEYFVLCVTKRCDDCMAFKPLQSRPRQVGLPGRVLPVSEDAEAPCKHDIRIQGT